MAVDTVSARKDGHQSMLVDITKIKPGNNPRTRFDEEKLQELADSIRQDGLLEPIIVRTDGNGGYELIAGERRYKACRMVGLSEIPATIREADDLVALRLAIKENRDREDVDPIDEARSFARYLQLAQAIDPAVTQARVAEDLGFKNQSTFSNYLRLLDLTEEIQDLVRSHDLSISHARGLLTWKDHPDIQKFLTGWAMGRASRELDDLNAALKQWTDYPEILYALLGWVERGAAPYDIDHITYSQACQLQSGGMVKQLRGAKFDTAECYSPGCSHRWEVQGISFCRQVNCFNEKEATAPKPEARPAVEETPEGHITPSVQEPQPEEPNEQPQESPEQTKPNSAGVLKPWESVDCSTKDYRLVVRLAQWESHWYCGVDYWTKDSGGGCAPSINGASFKTRETALLAGLGRLENWLQSQEPDVKRNKALNIIRLEISQLTGIPIQDVETRTKEPVEVTAVAETEPAEATVDAPAEDFPHEKTSVTHEAADIALKQISDLFGNRDSRYVWHSESLVVAMLLQNLPQSFNVYVDQAMDELHRNRIDWEMARWKGSMGTVQFAQHLESRNVDCSTIAYAIAKQLRDLLQEAPTAGVYELDFLLGKEVPGPVEAALEEREGKSEEAAAVDDQPSVVQIPAISQTIRLGDWIVHKSIRREKNELWGAFDKRLKESARQVISTCDSSPLDGTPFVTINGDIMLDIGDLDTDWRYYMQPDMVRIGDQIASIHENGDVTLYEVINKGPNEVRLKPIVDNQFQGTPSHPGWNTFARYLHAFVNRVSDDTTPEPPKEEDTTDDTVVARVYTDNPNDDRRTVFVHNGLSNDKFGTFRRKPSGALERVASPDMPMVPTFAEAQRNLDAWAPKRGYVLVESTEVTNESFEDTNLCLYCEHSSLPGACAFSEIVDTATGVSVHQDGKVQHCSDYKERSEATEAVEQAEPSPEQGATLIESICPDERPETAEPKSSNGLFNRLSVGTVIIMPEPMIEGAHPGGAWEVTKLRTDDDGIECKHALTGSTAFQPAHYLNRVARLATDEEIAALRPKPQSGETEEHWVGPEYFREITKTYLDRAKEISRAIEIGGSLYVCTAVSYPPNHTSEPNSLRVHQIIPASEYAGQTYDHLRMTREESDRPTLYHGYKVKYQGEEYVVVAPEVVFKARKNGQETSEPDAEPAATSDQPLFLIVKVGSRIVRRRDQQKPDTKYDILTITEITSENVSHDQGWALTIDALNEFYELVPDEEPEAERELFCEQCGNECDGTLLRYGAHFCSQGCLDTFREDAGPDVLRDIEDIEIPEDRVVMVQASRLRNDGDIFDSSISASPDTGRICKTFQFGGRLYAGIGWTPDCSGVIAWEMIPDGEWEGHSDTPKQHQVKVDCGDKESTDYHGLQVICGDENYVLQGPAVTFVAESEGK